MPVTPTAAEQRSIDLYLDLLHRCLTRSAFPERYRPINPDRNVARRFVWDPLRNALAARNLELVRQLEPDPARRAVGRDWPGEAETMIGSARIDNLRACVTQVLRDDVPGDLIETGVWRGGACIFMRGVLKAHGVTDRTVWVADSFEGLPKNREDSHPSDAGNELWARSQLAVSLEDVKANFARYELLDAQVRFLKGWFVDTLPSAPIERLAVLRLDGDLYASTMDALDALYPKLSPGGYCIVDDYLVIDACKQAVHDYRDRHGITEEIVPIDGDAVYWRRAAAAA